MGLFAAIGGLVAGAVGTIGTFVSGAAAAIGPVVSSIATGIGTAVKGAACILTNAIGKVAPYIGKFIDIANKVGNVVGAVSELLNIKKPGIDSPEELSFKAQSCGKTVEEFDSYNKYIEHLHNEVKLDREKFDALTPNERTAHTVVGSAIYCGGISEKIGISSVSPDMLIIAAKLGMSAEQLLNVFTELKSCGFGTQEECCDYLMGKNVGPDVAKIVQNAIKNAIKKADPSISDDAAGEQLYDMIGKIRNDDEANED